MRIAEFRDRVAGLLEEAIESLEYEEIIAELEARLAAFKGQAKSVERAEYPDLH